MLRVAHRDEALTLSAVDIASASSATDSVLMRQQMFEQDMLSDARHVQGI